MRAAATKKSHSISFLLVSLAVTIAYCIVSASIFLKSCDAFVMMRSHGPRPGPTVKAFVVTPRTMMEQTTPGNSDEIAKEGMGLLPLKAEVLTSFVSGTMSVLLSQPLVSWAAEASAEADYEYGAVNAPPIIPIVGGILAIGTALLPVLLRSGEEAFNEIRDRDDFGKAKDALDRDRRNKK
jgi:hypothetical protein